MESTTFKGDKQTSQFTLDFLWPSTISKCNIVYIHINDFQAMHSFQQQGSITSLEGFPKELEFNAKYLPVSGSITKKGRTEQTNFLLFIVIDTQTKTNQTIYKILDLNRKDIECERFSIDETTIPITLNKKVESNLL